jgi:hypothetical protein
MRADRLITEYLQRALAGHEDIRAEFINDVNEILKAVAREAEVLLPVECGDQSARLLVLAENDTTLYRLDEKLRVETLSLGRLTEGVLTEKYKVRAHYGDSSHHESITYTHQRLAQIGGSFSVVDDRLDFHDVREALLPLVGYAVGTKAG